MLEPSSNEIVTVFTCRHEAYFRDLETREQVPYRGPEAHCIECGNQIEDGEPVVHEGDEIVCYDCHNNALAWATVMHAG